MSNLTLFDKIFNLLPWTKIESRCRNCNDAIFNANSEWGSRGLCIHCNHIYKEGLKKGLEQRTQSIDKIQDEKDDSS